MQKSQIDEFNCDVFEEKSTSSSNHDKKIIRKSWPYIDQFNTRSSSRNAQENSGKTLANAKDLINVKRRRKSLSKSWPNLDVFENKINNNKNQANAQRISRLKMDSDNLNGSENRYPDAARLTDVKLSGVKSDFSNDLDAYNCAECIEKKFWNYNNDFNG